MFPTSGTGLYGLLATGPIAGILLATWTVAGPAVPGPGTSADEPAPPAVAAPPTAPDAPAAPSPTGPAESTPDTLPPASTPAPVPMSSLAAAVSTAAPAPTPAPTSGPVVAPSNAAALSAAPSPAPTPPRPRPAGTPTRAPSATSDPDQPVPATTPVVPAEPMRDAPVGGWQPPVLTVGALHALDVPVMASGLPVLVSVAGCADAPGCAYQNGDLYVWPIASGRVTVTWSTTGGGHWLPWSTSTVAR